jgi:hypothetical protein
MHLRNIVLVLVIVAAAAVQGRVALDLLPPNPVSKAIERSDDADRPRETMRQAGLDDAVTRVRRMEHACKPPDALMQRDYAYFYVAEVAKIPAAFWAGKAAQRHWQRGPAHGAVQKDALRTAIGFNDSPDCPWLPTQADMDSSRFMLAFLRIASSEGGSEDPSWHEVNEVSMLAYDTRTSKLYYLSASL